MGNRAAEGKRTRGGYVAKFAQEVVKGQVPWGVATCDLTHWNAAIIHCSCHNTPSLEEGIVMTTAQIGWVWLF